MTKKTALPMPDGKESNTPELDGQAESVCRWGAARAAAIVVLPVVGLLWLTGNIMYMVMRIARVYGVTLSEAATRGFISAIAGNALLLYLASPVPGLNVVIATCATYGIGKAAQAWIKDGMPTDVAKYKEEYEKAKKEGRKLKKEFRSDPRRKKPLR